MLDFILPDPGKSWLEPPRGLLTLTNAQRRLVVIRVRKELPGVNNNMGNVSLLIRGQMGMPPTRSTKRKI